MFKLKFFSSQWKEHLPLALILFFAGLVRFIGLDYGLPLWLVGDEVSHIFGALKMLEMKTVLPVLHSAEFGSIFYYTPHLSYLYLLPFAAAAGIKFLFFSGTFAQFENYLIADPSVFFIIARALSAIFGLATVYFVYATAGQMFQKKKIALFSALFIAFSYLAVSYSHWARHWTAITFFYALGIYILAHRGLTISRRYLFVALLMGIGVGINVQMTIFGVLVFLWFFLFDYQPLGKLLRQKWLWQALGLFILLFGLAFILWPKGYGYFLKVGEISSTGASKGLAGLVDFFWFYISNLIRAEPVLILFICLGLLTMFFAERRRALVFNSFIFLYFIIFYLFFEHVDRFILPLYPLMAISAGYGLAGVADKLSARPWRWTLIAAMGILLVIPILRFDYLLIKNDTRVQAIAWTQANLPAEAKVAVWAPLMRLPTTPAILQEQQGLDVNSLRQVDRAEMNLDNKLRPRQTFQALNLYNIQNKVFFGSLAEYLKKNNYQYFIYHPAFAQERGRDFLDNSLGQEIKVFTGSGDFAKAGGHERIPDGFGAGLKEIFYSSSLGPEIKIIKLN